MRKIAIYGKGGIGKSTTTSNLSAALAYYQNLRIMQIGCDPKADSTIALMKGLNIPTILDVIREKKTDFGLDDVIFSGFSGVLCAEAGGPTPGVGCAGRGIIAAFEALKTLHAFEVFQPDIVFYDVLGDVVCGGFAMPLRKGYAEEVYIVTSGEKMSLFAAKNIACAVEQFKGRGYASLKGLILNSRGIPNELKLVKAVSEELNTQVIIEIPRDTTVQVCEEKNMTVIEGVPDSSLAGVYKKLANILMAKD